MSCSKMPTPAAARRLFGSLDKHCTLARGAEVGYVCVVCHCWLCSLLCDDVVKEANKFACGTVFCMRVA